MKILHVITSLLTGGAEHLMVDLLPRLRDMGHDVELVVFKGVRTPFYDQLEQQGIKIHAFGKHFYNPLYAVRLLRMMGNYDIVHTHNTAPQIFAAFGSVLCSVVLVTTEHNTSNRRRNWKWYAPLDKWMYRQYARVICISDQAEANLREQLHTQSDKIMTIYNGVDVQRFMDAEAEAEVRRQYAGYKTVMMVAAFRSQKDHETLIRAFTLLPEDYHLLLVGDGECRAKYEQMVQELHLGDRVHFLGLRTDVPQLLKAADIVVMSSHFEGLSLSNIEGMASGRPFVASDVDGLREVTQGYGLLFPHGDAQALADTINHLGTDRAYYEQVAAACLERARQFDINKMVEGYLNVYRSLS